MQKFSVGVHRRRGANTLESLNTDIYSDYYFIISLKDRLKFYTIKFSIRFFFMKCNLKCGLFFSPSTILVLSLLRACCKKWIMMLIFGRHGILIFSCLLFVLFDLFFQITEYWLKRQNLMVSIIEQHYGWFGDFIPKIICFKKNI